MAILLDHRAGSEELICHPPFNKCLDCGSILTIERKPPAKGRSKGSIISATCPVSPSHKSLARLVNLAKLNGREGIGDPDAETDSPSRVSADVHFTGNGPSSLVTIGIELKSLSDMISSLDSKRLTATQIPFLLDNYTVPYLIIYGAYRCCPDTGLMQTQRYDPSTHKRTWKPLLLGKRTFKWSFLENFLSSPSITSTRLRFRQFFSIQDAAFWIGSSLYPTWQKPYDEHRSLFGFDDSQRLPAHYTLAPDVDPITYQIMLTAASLPSLGYDRSVAVAAHFRSVEEMFWNWRAVVSVLGQHGIDPDIIRKAIKAGEISESEWAEIVVKTKQGRGRDVRIGPVRAKAIVNAIRKRRSSK